MRVVGYCLYGLALCLPAAGDPVSAEPNSITITNGMTTSVVIRGENLGIYSGCRLYESKGKPVEGNFARLGRARQHNSLRDVEINIHRQLPPGVYALRLFNSSRESAVPLTIQVVDSIQVAGTDSPGIYNDPRYGLKGAYPAECTKKLKSDTEVTFDNPDKSLTVTFSVVTDQDLGAPSKSAKELETRLREDISYEKDRLLQCKRGEDWCAISWKESKGEKALVYNKIYVRKSRNVGVGVRVTPRRESEFESLVEWVESRFYPGP